MASFVGATAQKEPLNWERSKAVRLWGVPGSSIRSRGVQKGDRLFIWKSRVGYIAEAAIAGQPRRPMDRSEAPWPGGLRRFSIVIPIEVKQEYPKGFRLNFANDRQEITGLSTNSLRLGLAPITEESAEHISRSLRLLVEESQQG